MDIKELPLLLRRSGSKKNRGDFLEPRLVPV
jgi:hypothetical protein